MPDLPPVDEAMYPWLTTAVTQWYKRIQANRVPNGILLQGPPGIGKMQFATIIAQSLLCQNFSVTTGPCRNCQPCNWFAAGTHPDFFTVQPEEKSEVIKIEQVRTLCEKMVLTSHAGRYKVTILSPAEVMNRNAANAFLKTLEEPVQNTVFILVSDIPGLLPVTIRSRCQTVTLATPDYTTAEQWLVSQQVNNAPYYMALAAGRPLLALEYSRSGADKVHDQALNDLLGILADTSDITDVAGDWIKLDLGIITQWQLHWIGLLIKYKMRAQRLENTRFPAIDRLILLNNHLDLSLLFSVREKLIHTINLLKTSVNKQLLMESLLAHWRQLERRV